MKCKHLNGQFNELMDAVHTRYVENGKIDSIGYNDVGNITGYEFRCYDCKKDFRWLSSLLAPKWAQKYFDAL